MRIPGKDIEEYAPRDVTTVRILGATERLLAKTSFDKLSVTAICEEAGISRQTFYQHFADKYAIAEWLWDRHAASSVTDPERVNEWRAVTTEMVRAFGPDCVIVHAALRSSGCGSLLEYGRARRSEFLLAQAARRCDGPVPDGVAFEIGFFVRAESDAIREWVLHGSPISVESLAALIERCLPEDLRALFERSPRE